MNDIVDSQGREAMLSDHSGSVACSNVNMTSIDSGVETGNDSNDGPTVQQEGQQHQSASQIIDSGMMADVESDGDFSNMYNWSTLVSCSSYNPMFIPETPAETRRNPKNEMFQIIRNRYKACELFQSNICGCYNMIKERVLRRKRMTHSFSSSVWQTERIQRRMRFAATTNNVTLMKRLLEFGVSPNNHDEHGRTPLHISACRGYTEIVRLLLENGADPNQRDCIGNTPLHLATVNNKLSVVMSLLTAGTDVLALDSYGYNPLQLAKTKLRMLQRSCDNDDMIKVKEEMHSVINMLMAYLQKQNNMQEQVETLSNFCSRFSLSSTSDQVQDDVKNLLENINALNITD